MTVKNPLSILTDGSNSGAPPVKQKKNPRQEAQAKFDRMWLREPEKFDVGKSASERMRLFRTFAFVKEMTNLAGKKIADLGCGAGYLSRMLRDAGGIVDAIDISQNALKQLKAQGGEGIHPIQDYMPHTMLEDSSYDIVVAADLIAHLEVNQYRLFFSELARLVKSDGYVVCSTAVDIYSENALQSFVELTHTELDCCTWLFSYHSLQIRLLDFFKAPSRFRRASRDKLYREKSLNKRYSVAKWWFAINSCVPLSYFWAFIALIAFPFCKLLENNDIVIRGLEKLAHFLGREGAISHVLFMAKRRSFFAR